jgi:hypothetical protein
VNVKKDFMMMAQKFAKNAEDGVKPVNLMPHVVPLAQKEVIEKMKIVLVNQAIMI